ncbi:MAG: response regulator transcription factor [Actinomycetota bacterium]|nr:response regulator transcription factor [Actinomycetota bacterium]
MIVHHRVDHNGERSVERVLVIARHRIFGEALVRSLRREGLAAAYAPPHPGASATQAGELRPTVLVLAVDGDDKALLDCLATVSGHEPSVRVLILARARLDADPYLAVFAGATSVLTLHVPLRDLLQVVKGTRSVASITDRRTMRSSVRMNGQMSLVDRLTEREREVLGELMAGTSGEDIAVNLQISRNTVRTHVQNILTKLGARTRLEAAAVGRQAGLRPAHGRRHEVETAEFGA